MNNTFLVTIEANCHWFHAWRSHAWKSLTNRITSDSKIVIQGNECINLFLTRYFTPWIHNSTKNSNQSMISSLSLRTFLFWRHHIWFETSRDRGALALWRYIHRLFLHAPIGTKTIFVNNNLEYRFLTGIYGLACKNICTVTPALLNSDSHPVYSYKKGVHISKFDDIALNNITPFSLVIIYVCDARKAQWHSTLNVSTGTPTDITTKFIY